MPPPPTVAETQVAPWKDAASLVEEDRGEPVGRKAQVQTPDELKHYADRRRFLAVQVAEVHEHDFELPHDFAELVELIRENNLVELDPVGKDYVLYGVGANASDEPFFHYDRATGDNIPLFSSEEEFKQEYEKLSGAIKEPQSQITGLESELRKLTKRERERRTQLQSQINELRKEITPLVAQKKALEASYKSAERREILIEEWKTLFDIATDFGGKSYDLNDPAARRRLKVRLLSFIRPEARDVLLEIAHKYKERFDRPLPVTSVVRPEQYQARLSKVNPNATRISTPPHSTGLAFDIYYYFMSAAEQDYLMSVIATLKDEGKLEALRETRDHIHVFAFADGQRPDENLIADAMGDAVASKPAKKPEPKQSKQAKGKKETKSEKLARSSKGKKNAKTSQVARGKQQKGKPVAAVRKSRR